jgi:hypothetical protein
VKPAAFSGFGVFPADVAAFFADVYAAMICTSRHAWGANEQYQPPTGLRQGHGGRSNFALISSQEISR